jgi:hypothetical protein
MPLLYKIKTIKTYFHLMNESDLNRIIELLLLFIGRSPLVSLLTFVTEKIIKARWLSLAFRMEETVYTWHLIFIVPSVSWFPCCEQTHSSMWVGRGRSLLESFLRRSTLCGIWMPLGGEGWIVYCFIHLSLLCALRRLARGKTTDGLQSAFSSF